MKLPESKIQKIRNRFNRIQKLKNQVNQENKIEIANKISNLALEILEIEPNNKMAINEMIKSYMFKKEYDVGRIFGQKALEENPNSISILYTMAELELRGRNAEKAREYNAQILLQYPNDKKANEQKERIEARLEQLRKEGKIKGKFSRVSKEEQPEFVEIAKQNMLEQEQQEFGKRDVKQEEKYTLEEQQLKFAKDKILSERYSLEEKEEYMRKITKMFLDGQVNNKKLEEIKQELYKYPNKTESVLFLSEIFYAIEGNEERGMQELNNSRYLVENEETLEEKILNFRKRLDAKKYIEKSEDEQKVKLEQLKKEQIEYSNQRTKRIDNKELTK